MTSRFFDTTLDVGRRSLIARAAGFGLVAAGSGSVAKVTSTRPLADLGTKPPVARASEGSDFWPDGARFVVSISMQFESGAQGTPLDGPLPPVKLGFEDTATASWYAYGVREGIPRLLDLWDRYRIKVTSHMLGQAVDLEPALAREIVERGHEAAGHGQASVPSYLMTPDEERAAYATNIQSIEKATGFRPVGLNAYGMRHTPATLGLLQELGFRYHADSLSLDEPSLATVNSKPFVIVPYTLRNNDLVRFANTAMTARGFVQDLRDDFDALYEESAKRRRMMSVATHDRISGTPALAQALGDFLRYARSKPGVTFMRKDEIARWILTEKRHEAPA